MNNNDSAGPEAFDLPPLDGTPPSRIGRPPARKQFIGTSMANGVEVHVLRDTYWNLDWAFRRRGTAVLVARQLLWDPTATPPCGRESDVNAFAVALADWEELTLATSPILPLAA